MLTLPEAARRAGRDPETIRRWIRAGKLKSQRIGTQYMIDERALGHTLGGGTLPVPAWLTRTSTGEPMPKVVSILRRQRARH